MSCYRSLRKHGQLCTAGDVASTLTKTPDVSQQLSSHEIWRVGARLHRSPSLSLSLSMAQSRPKIQGPMERLQQSYSALGLQHMDIFIVDESIDYLNDLLTSRIMKYTVATVSPLLASQLSFCLYPFLTNVFESAA